VLGCLLMRNKKRLICELSVFALSSWFGILRSASMYENSDFRVRIVDQLLTGADTFLLYHNTVSILQLAAFALLETDTQTKK